jgi:hypothetical protein
MVSTFHPRMFVRSGELNYAYGSEVYPVGRVIFNWSYSAPADGNIWIADAAYELESIEGVPNVVGSDGGAVTGVFRKCDGTEAPSSGVLLHTGTYDFKGTVHTVQALTLEAQANIRFADGERLAFDGTGTMTAATGCVTFVLRRLAD